MAGNVQEWTADAFADYNSDPVTNPRRSSSDESPRVIRGGSWISEVADKMRATFRSGFVPGYRINSLGFRCARGERI
jgi:formylglycine-generating enzyme required for sulfatase activity